MSIRKLTGSAKFAGILTIAIWAITGVIALVTKL